MHHRTTARLLAAALTACLPAAAAPRSPLPVELALELPARTVATWQALDAAVTLSVKAGTPSAVFLPRVFRLVVTGDGARFEPSPPVPGPPVNPLAEAKRLAGGGRMRLEFPDLGDAKGRWRLAPGRYQVAVEYALDDAAARELRATFGGAAGGPQSELWTGRTVSPPVAIEVVEPSATWRSLEPLLAELQSKPASAETRAALARLGAPGEAECLAMVADRKLRAQRMPMIAVLRALGAMRSTKAVPALRPLVDSEDEFVGDAAVLALGDIGDRSATPALVGRLQRVGRYDRSWRVTLDALQRLGDPGAVPALRPFASDPEAQVADPARAAIRALLGGDAGR